MENNEIIKKRGRPRILSDEQRKGNKTNYQLNKEWFCPICYPIRNYTLAGKTCHLKTKKHKRYQAIYDEIIHKDIM